MKPVDMRNDQFADLQGRIDGDRYIVFQALEMFGPCTTRQLAERMARDILSVRPRVTELCELLAVELVDQRGHEGVYKARPIGEWAAAFCKAQTQARGEQLTLNL